MKDFKAHLFTIISILLGLVMAQYMISFARIALDWDHLTITWVHKTYMVLSFALILLYWWSLHDIAEHVTRNFFHFLLYVVPVGLMFMGHQHLFPQDAAAYTTKGLNDTFHEHLYGFAIVNSVMLGCLAITSLIAFFSDPPTIRKGETIALHVVRFAAAAWCLVIHERREAMHEDVGIVVLVVLMILYTLGKWAVDRPDETAPTIHPEGTAQKALAKLGALLDDVAEQRVLGATASDAATSLDLGEVLNKLGTNYSKQQAALANALAEVKTQREAKEGLQAELKKVKAAKD